MTQRKGQALFNAASALFPQEVLQLINTEPPTVVDCFYVDENAKAFIIGLASILDNGGVGRQYADLAKERADKAYREEYKHFDTKER